ncbi:MAG: hypothetical protein MZV70_22285 [Desulfobacterales bacterium]|nr:hypothetical protein [Desulfobacterales bacterium]
MIAHMYEERGLFTGMAESLDSISEKLIRRHPHVAADSGALDAGRRHPAVERDQGNRRRAETEGLGAGLGLPRPASPGAGPTSSRKEAAKAGFDLDGRPGRHRQAAGRDRGNRGGLGLRKPGGRGSRDRGYPVLRGKPLSVPGRGSPRSPSTGRGALLPQVPARGEGHGPGRACPGGGQHGPGWDALRNGAKAGETDTRPAG